ncbi:MAG: hypothetical protein VKL39_20230, partial [Leptolyngbyaceae bacterium]|nr:hypothetical protein [Leptolyngbyaceae bacterium]
EERDFGDEEVWDKEYRYARGDIFKTFPELEEMFSGKMGAVIRSIFGSHFKIFYGVLYKSVRIGNEPQGSALWHSDSGPGTCVNIMFCLNTTDRSNGAMEFVPWDVSLSLFSSERAAMRDLVTNGQRDRLEIRKSMCDYYNARINQDFSDRITCLNGSPGLLLAFRNNVVHRGGFPEDGKVRYACVFHLYPSISQAPLDTYRANGVSKNGPFPTDPAF